MPTPPHFETLFKQFSQALPPGTFSLQQDLEKNLKAALNKVLHDMNLVTREEFELQSALLSRTREKLEVLEAQVTELEAEQARQMAASDPSVKG